MKSIALLFLFLSLISAACTSSIEDTTPIAVVAGLTSTTAVPDHEQDQSQEQLPRKSQEDLIAAQAGADDLHDASVTEALSAIDEAAGSPETGAGFTSSRIPTYSYKIINKYPHDRGSFIQGLVVDDLDILLEGSGLLGDSSLRRVDVKTGEVMQFLALPAHFFGEGITVFDERIIQLTWKSGIGFIYDSDSFDLLDTFEYSHEGWGITHDGQQLIVSDGTPSIHFWNAETLQETHHITVHDENGPIFNINELEFVDGEIFANVWLTDTIIRIDPSSGEVLGRIDLTGLLAQEDRDGTEGVLNGIAYDLQSERLFVTGKRWPTLYEIELVSIPTPE